MEGYESLEEGEIPSPPPSVGDHAPNKSVKRSILKRSSKPFKHKRDCKRRKRKSVKSNPITDFDLMRTKCLERLQERIKQEQEEASKEMVATEIDDVEMEDAHVITLGDSEEDELKQLRELALSSQKNNNKASDDDELEKAENEFSLRAEALKTAILKKRPSILIKKQIAVIRKHLLKNSNDNVGNVKANQNNPGESSDDIDIKSSKENLEIVDENRSDIAADIDINFGKENLEIVDESCSDIAVGIDINFGKENLDKSEINDEDILREQLLASIKTSNKSKISKSLVDNKPIEQISDNLENVPDKSTAENIDLIPSNSNVIPIITISPIKYPPPSESKVFKSKLILKNAVPNQNGLVNKKNAIKKDIKKLPVKVIVPKTVEQRIVVNLGPDSSDDDYEEPKNVPVPGALMNSIDELLLNARRRTDNSNLTSTPEAVYAHLPPSQRMEYVKLKKQLAEREENLKLKNVENKTLLETVIAQNKMKTIPEVINTPNRKTEILPNKPVINSPKKKINVHQTLAVNTKPIPSTSGKLLNQIKHGKLKSKKYVAPNVTTANNISSFLKKNTVKSNTTEKPKDSKQSNIEKSSNITSATQLMTSLKRELVLEKIARDELARLKLQVSCAEQKVKVHSTRVILLRSRIKRLLESTKTTGKVVNEKNYNKRKVPSDSAVNDISIQTSSKLISLQLSTNSSGKLATNVNNKDGNKDKIESNTTTTVNSLENKSEVNSLLMLKDENNAQETWPILKKRNIKVNFEDYVSPLNKIESQINPLVEFCSHDLTGKCRDPECQYQHMSSPIR